LNGEGGRWVGIGGGSPPLACHAHQPTTTRRW
jgi:hypothetical protein